MIKCNVKSYSEYNWNKSLHLVLNTFGNLSLQALMEVVTN